MHGELHDHTSRPGGPVAGNRRSQRKTGVGGEEEPADCRECREPEKAKGDRGQNPRGPLQLRGNVKRTVTFKEEFFLFSGLLISLNLNY